MGVCGVGVEKGVCVYSIGGEGCVCLEYWCRRVGVCEVGVEKGGCVCEVGVEKGVCVWGRGGEVWVCMWSRGREGWGYYYIDYYICVFLSVPIWSRRKRSDSLPPKTYTTIPHALATYWTLRGSSKVPTP